MILNIPAKTQNNNLSDFKPKIALPLVYTPNSEPLPNSVTCSDFGEVSADGTVNPKNDSNQSKISRYQRQSVVRKLLPHKRVAKCLRARISTNVLVLRSKEHQKCHFGNLVVCGSVWNCPVCASKISQRRRIELTKALKQHSEGGGSSILVTFTYPHGREDNLQDLLDKQKKAMEWFFRHRSYKNLKKRYMKRGRIRALEVNHGEANGWHPHIHEIWMLNLHLHDYESLKLEVFNLWVKACERFGLGKPSWEHGVDIRGGDYAAQYATKWGIEDEMTKAHIKKGRNGSRSPFQLLDDYMAGDKRSGALFIEYSKAFFGFRQLRWYGDLKAQFDLSELSDEEVATNQDEKADLLAEIEPEEWRAIVRTSTLDFDNRITLLLIAENSGVDAMKLFIADVVKDYKKKRRKFLRDKRKKEGKP